MDIKRQIVIGIALFALGCGSPDWKGKISGSTTLKNGSEVVTEGTATATLEVQPEATLNTPYMLKFSSNSPLPDCNLAFLYDLGNHPDEKRMYILKDKQSGTPCTAIIAKDSKPVQVAFSRGNVEVTMGGEFKVELSYMAVGGGFETRTLEWTASKSWF